jgi:4-hydroxy-2-oxoheptanedioate aldolase
MLPSKPTHRLLTRIDIFTIGPGDLSHSLGFTGQLDHPEVLKTIDYIIDTVVAGGKHVFSLIQA